MQHSIQIINSNPSAASQGSSATHHFNCSPEQTLLQAALLQGIFLAHGCQTGKCGSCAAIDVNTQQSILLCNTKPIQDMLLKANVLQASHIAVRKMPAKIASIHYLADDIIELSLQLAKQIDLQHLPGQYIDMLLENGIRRSYSISAFDADNNVLSLHIRKKQQGLLTTRLFEADADKALKVGQIMRIEAPLGGFFLQTQPQTKQLIFIATGTGFAPIMHMLNCLLKTIANQDANNIKQEKNTIQNIDLYWGGRQSQDIYAYQQLCDWVDAFASQMIVFKFHIVLSESQVFTSLNGNLNTHASFNTGLVHQQVLSDVVSMNLDLNNHQTQVYACGNPHMIEAAKQSLIAKNLAQDAFFADAFV